MSGSSASRWRSAGSSPATTCAATARHGLRRDDGDRGPRAPRGRSRPSSRPWPSVARRPRRHWPRAAPSARSSRAAPTRPGAPPSGSAIGRESARAAAASVEGRLARYRGHRGRARRRGRRRPGRSRGGGSGSPGSRSRWPRWIATARPSSPGSSPSSRSSWPPPGAGVARAVRGGGRGARPSARRPRPRPSAVRGEVREAERAVEAARREAARVGGELAAVNQFLRHHAGAPHGAAALADDLDVDSGLRAGRGRRARRPPARRRGRRPCRRPRRCLTVPGPMAGVRSWSAMPPTADGDDGAAEPPAPGAARLIEHVRAQGRALALARALLRDTWVVEDLDQVADRLRGAWRSRAADACGRRARASCARRRRSGRSASWPSATAASSSSPSQSAPLRPSSTRAAGSSGPPPGCRRPIRRATGLTNAHRAAVRALDERREEERRITALIERRRAAPDDGVGGDGPAVAPSWRPSWRPSAGCSSVRSASGPSAPQRLERVRARRRPRPELVPAVASVIAALEDGCGSDRAAAGELRGGAGGRSPGR